eukprot:gnl/TRDRNA2_/TRDRNA2_38678_c1_seq1.p1 gnl/TRDRNA2_/TRDRNA2_38678_c1~~gnl/TRDRNA2_/TRDRNA2_38678_c1_seq1.p1  ORF type:complete len:189 (+),score=30.88 gnl/TRDRNA2_/TRDRNA2_38678_c1_seq1:56-568(+)
MVLAGTLFLDTVIKGEGASTPRWFKGLPMNITRGTLHVTSMTMAWCTLFWGEWQIYIPGFMDGSRIAGCLLVALGHTFNTVLWIFVLDYIANRFQVVEQALRSIMTTFGVLVGIAWARVFNVAFQDLAETADMGGSKEVRMPIFVVCLMIVVLPAWRMYILPKAFPKVWG